ncbi:MAG: TIM44-like domain-containing protein [Mariprofundales bacterium]|nr:TIM44-like domain-containing protein [Mariprofundales bacterium]
MKKWMILMIVAVAAMALWPADQADARRFGGGFSFGSHHRSFGRSHASQPRHTSSRNATANRRPRSGLMGGIAGLAMGGLLGAMFFGGGFSGINMFDILIIAAIGWGVMWWFRRKAPKLSQQGFRQPMSAGSDGHHTYSAEPEGMAQGSGSSSGPSGAMERPQMDETVFLDASRSIFIRMQAAWDKQDIEDIRRFCRPEVAAHVEQEIQSQGEQRNQTEVVTLEAQLLESWIESGREWAAVTFTAMMKEQTLDHAGTVLENENRRVEETWTFCHDASSSDPTWYLAGIAQAS